MTDGHVLRRKDLGTDESTNSVELFSLDCIVLSIVDNLKFVLQRRQPKFVDKLKKNQKC